MSLEAIKYKDGKLELLDQLKLPHETIYLNIETLQDGWKAINEMNVNILKTSSYQIPNILLFLFKVRGAPAIG